MTREIVPVELTNSTGFPRRFTCASGAAIVKGTLLTLSDPRTAAAHSAAVSAIAGIASMDKSSTDLSTSISGWTDGVFEMYASGAIAIGDPVVAAAGANWVKTGAGLLASGAAVIGYAMETAADTEPINVRVRL